ncbi:MAG: hypothetical protein KAY24_18035 [Candidatus Eisenbacteria sp.]|nr:hypothetical protein [Candidatus Eisenbacteria bacterium]
MKHLISTLVLLGFLVSNAGAHPMNLDCGVLITHYVPELQFSEPPGEEMCELYGSYAITHHSQQINRIDTPGGTPNMQPAAWFIIAAWTEEKEFCGVQLGIGDYDPAIFTFASWSPCCNPSGCIEIVGWIPEPGPNTGNAWVAVGDEPWYGNYVPVYAFYGYAYGDADPGIIPLIPDPTVPYPFAGTANCVGSLSKWDAHELGGMGINLDGIYAEPEASPPVAVCCVAFDCSVVTEEECEAMQGVWHAHLSSCAGDPCLVEVRVCCIGEVCILLGSPEQCAQVGGEWHPGLFSCGPNPCIPSGPAKGTSWGAIKGFYR